MRVMPISVCDCGKVRNTMPRKDYASERTILNSSQESVKSVSFKNAGVGATIGTFVGLGVGILISAATGGIATPLVATCIGCAAGGILGSEDKPSDGKKSNDNKPHDDMGGHDYDDNGFSHYD